jgi:hypothetical protein
MKINVWQVIAVVFLIWAVAGSALAANYYQTSQNQQTIIYNLQSVLAATTMNVSIQINYGNGTVQWSNNTVVPIGVKLLNATQMVATVNSSTSSLGTFVTGINGVFQDTAANKYWVYNSWNGTGWDIVWVGAADYQLHSNEIIQWYLMQF